MRKPMPPPFLSSLGFPMKVYPVIGGRGGLLLFNQVSQMITIPTFCSKVLFRKSSMSFNLPRMPLRFHCSTSRSSAFTMSGSISGST